MIGSLRGTVLERRAEAEVLLEAGGVGYYVSVTPHTLSQLNPGTDAFIHVHHHIREDAQTLFGFLSRDERATFQTLIATHGVGPSMAMAILATHSPSALVDIVIGADIGALTLVPGVGKKTAERLLIELKNRLNLPTLDINPVGSPAAIGSVVGNVREALLGLGYAPEEIRDALRDVPSGSTADASVMLREALQVLGAKRA